MTRNNYKEVDFHVQRVDREGSKLCKKIAQVWLGISRSGPDSTPKQAPIRTGDRKTCQSQTSKKPKGFVVGHIYIY